MLTDASKLGWGAVLLVGRKIIRCAHGLWASGFRHHVSNELELEALCRALCAFRPWIFGAPICAIMDDTSTVSPTALAHTVAPRHKKQAANQMDYRIVVSVM